MPIDWKKLKEKAAEKFAEAVIKGEELAGKAEQKAAEFGHDVLKKVDQIKKEKGKDAPKNG